MASIQNNNETMHLVKFRTGKIDTFKNAEAVPLDAGTLYFAHSDLNIAESDNEEGEGRPYKNAPYGYIVYDVPNMDGATRVVMGDHARITTYLENPIWLHIGGSDDNPDAGASICLQGRASDKDENLADVLGSKGKPFTLSYTDIGADLSSDWTWGRSEGPILNLTVNGVPHAVAAIPAATGETLTTTTTNADGEEISTEYKGISGIVTTEVQSFAGAKTFKAPLTIDLPETFTGGGVAGEEGIGDYAFAIKTNDDQPNSLEFNMRRASKGEAFSLYSLTVNNTTKLQNKTYYTLSLGSQFKFLAAENPDQKGVHEVGMGLGNVIHLISTNLSTDAQTSITTDLTKLTDKELITPFYEKNTIKREKGKLLSVGEDEDGLLTPYSVTLGTTTQPIYFADGAPTSCAEYAGGTRLNINGTEYTKEATIYAPLSAPTNSTTK